MLEVSQYGADVAVTTWLYVSSQHKRTNYNAVKMWVKCKNTLQTPTWSGSFESLRNISPGPPTPASSVNDDEGFLHYYPVPYVLYYKIFTRHSMSHTTLNWCRLMPLHNVGTMLKWSIQVRVVCRHFFRVPDDVILGHRWLRFVRPLESARPRPSLNYPHPQHHSRCSTNSLNCVDSPDFSTSTRLGSNTMNQVWRVKLFSESRSRLWASSFWGRGQHVKDRGITCVTGWLSTWNN
jgi:hypothetical protein